MRSHAVVVELEAREILEPGCYMHLATGLLIRVGREDVDAVRERFACLEAGRMLRLSDAPNTPVRLLREAAIRSHHVPRF